MCSSPTVNTEQMTAKKRRSRRKDPAPTKTSPEPRRIVAKADECQNPQQLAELLRREGVSQAQLDRWRQETKTSDQEHPAPPLQPHNTTKTKVSVRQKVQELLNPLQYDLRYPISYLYMWYQSFQQVMRWIGAVAAGMLTFTASFLLSDLVNATPRNAVSLPSDPASIELSVALFDPFFLRVSLLLLAASLLAVLLTLFVTYNWLVAGIKSAFYPMQADLVQEGLLEEGLAREFKSYGAVLSMKQWGMISFVLGGIAGICLLLGTIAYTISAWGVIRAL